MSTKDKDEKEKKERKKDEKELIKLILGILYCVNQSRGKIGGRNEVFVSQRVELFDCDFLTAFI
jgi:hypothetical protein